MRFSAMRHVVWLALVVACGARSGLVSSDSESYVSGGGGVSGAIGAGGTRASRAGAGGMGGLGVAGHGGAGNGGAGGTANRGGAPSGGVASGGANQVCTCPVNERCCEAGESCTVNTCVCSDPELVRVAPPNARNGVQAAQQVQAVFSCAPDPKITRDSAMRVTGAFAGRLRAAFPTPTPLASIVLQPFAPDMVRASAYFPGELLTGLLGAPLGGPFAWQFRAAVRAKSSGKFTNTGQTLNAAEDVALADLDRDGDLDMVLGYTPDTFGRVYMNDGKGNFSPGATLSAVRAPLLGDIDGDGDVDIVADDLYLNDGAGHFTKSQALGEVHTLFDADNDGDLDVFTVQNDSNWLLQQNDGAGHFTAMPLGNSYVWDAKAGDLDNDGDLDLVVLAISTATPEVFRGAVLLNDGKGMFTEINGGLMNDASRSIALGDVDGDGDLDVFIASWGAAGAINPPDQVWLNDGTAHFSLGNAPLSGSPQLVMADVDGDGDLDAIAGQHPPYSNAKGQPSLILLNDGAGHFTQSGTIGDSNFQHVALGDLDGDGDLDAAIAQWNWTSPVPAQIWLQDGS